MIHVLDAMGRCRQGCDYTRDGDTRWPHRYDERLYRGGRFEFRWDRPKLTVYRAADPGFGFVLNRYPGIVIGIALRVNRRVFGLTWGRPRWERLDAPAGHDESGQ
jgi:hypothetical protein